MNVQSALKGQYHAALAMLREAIEKCPDDLWFAGEHPRTNWRIAYHALFFTHLYLQHDEREFRPWEGHRAEANFTVSMPWPPHDAPQLVEPYSREEMLEYWQICDAMVDPCVDALDLDRQECGFPWYDMPKLDHQIVNIRHIQQHAGQLAELLAARGVDVDWA